MRMSIGNVVFLKGVHIRELTDTPVELFDLSLQNLFCKSVRCLTWLSKLHVRVLVPGQGLEIFI